MWLFEFHVYKKNKVKHKCQNISVPSMQLFMQAK